MAGNGLENKIYGHPRFCKQILKTGLACLNLSGVIMENIPRATMRVAPVDPKKTLGLKSPFVCQVIRQAGMPFTSSNFSFAKPGGSLYSNLFKWSFLQAGITLN